MDNIQIRVAQGLGGLHILHLTGPLTLNTIFDFQDTIRSQSASGLIIVLSGVPYVDSGGLGAILGAYASCQRKGLKFALAAVPPRVVTMLQVARVDALVPRYDTLDAAEAELAPKTETA
jgi:anti-sigma B factor antagonist